MMKKGIKRALAYVLTVFILITELYVADDSVIHAQAAETDASELTETTVYFHGGDDWGSVYAYAYGASETADGQALGNWPGKEAESVGDGFYKVEVPSAAFTVIFNNNGNGKKTADTGITANNTALVRGEKSGTADEGATDVYAVASYGSLEEAKEAVGAGSPGTSGKTTVYFHGGDDWGSVYAYAYGASETADGQALGNWPGKEAESVGDGFYKVEVPSAAFTVIFNNNGNGKKTADTGITANNTALVRGEKSGTADEGATDVYAVVSYGSLEEAKEAVSAGSPGTSGKTTVYFHGGDDWGLVYAYAYGASETADGQALGNWPGKEAESVGDGFYKVEVPSAAFTIIFNNNGNGKKIEDTRIEKDNAVLVRGTQTRTEDNGATAVYAAKTYDSIEDAKNDMKTTVNLLTTKEWGTIRATVKLDTETLLDQVEVTKADDLGKNWWQIKVPVNATEHPFTISFSDGTNQKTANITTQEVYLTDANDKQYPSSFDAEVDLGLQTLTRVWFYNVYGYGTVKVHAWNASGNIFANDPEAIKEAENSKWYYVDVPAKAPFNIQFIGEASKQEGYVQGGNVYLASTDNFFGSKEEAEEFMANASTMIYFLNHDGTKTVLDEVYAYAYTEQGALKESFPGVKATPAVNMGENWWAIEIAANALLTPFNLTISGGSDAAKLKDVTIDNYKDNFVTAVENDTTVYKTKNAAALTVGLGATTTIYLLNNRNWSSTGAYVYGSEGEALGSWGTTTPIAATELYDFTEHDEMWLKVDVPAPTPFSLIFYNRENDAERTELVIPNAYSVYVTGSGEVYGSLFEAEAAVGLIDTSELATIYFYNSRGWDKGDINAYTFRKINGESVTIGKSWPGQAAEKATEIGDNWWKVRVPVKRTVLSEETAFYIVFNDGVNQMQDCLINDPNKIYVIPTAETFATPEEAMAAAANDPYDDNCQEGANKDLTDYIVSYQGAGASLPYITYEAEAAVTNAEVLKKNMNYRETIQSEASGREAVKLDAAGEYVEFTLTEASNALVLRYSIPDTADGLGQDATLSLYIDGKEKQDLQVTSKYAWLYGAFPYNNNAAQGKAHFFYDEIRVLLDEVLPAGTKIRLQKDAEDTAEYYVIDFIESELVADALTQPANSLSVVEFGAVPNDGKDDRAAFEACITAAKEQGKEVWIPAGTFNLIEKKVIEAFGVTIRGAGMWHTNLYGAGAAFKYEGTSKFYDFAMTGVSTVRDDSGDLAGIEGTGSRATNITIQNIWMEHMKVGVWTNNTENLVIQGCRIRNTYADGINLNSATVNATVRNNNLRNTGDDCIAIWPWMADCNNNLIAHNTIQVPSLANGIAIYGGGNNVVESNYVSDTINNGAGVVVGSEFESAKQFTAPITVKNNILDRCGSMQSDENYAIGAIWIWSSTRFFEMHQNINVYNNVMNDCHKVGITIECGNPLTNVNIQNNKVYGAEYAVFEYYPGSGTGVGSGKIGNLQTKDITGEIYKDDAPDFNLVKVDESISDDSVSDSGNQLKPEEEEKIYNLAIKSPEGIKLSSSAKKLLEKCFTEYELSRMKDGVNLYIDIVAVTKSTVDKQLIAPFLGNRKIGTIFDIALFKVVGNDRELLSNLGEENEILLTIDIPEAYRGKNYAFSMIRIHDGEVAVLEDLDKDSNTITISTNKFSEYVLIYEENQSGGGEVQPPSGSNDQNQQLPSNTTSSTAASPNTRDNTSYLYLLMALAAGVVLIVSFMKLSKEKH